MPKSTSSAPSSPGKDQLNATRRHHKLLPTTSTTTQCGPSGQDILVFLIASRLLNALVIQTFFQPDEYFQALEPAWELAFGAGAGAWITWEWKSHIRSAIHPAIFALAYQAADVLTRFLPVSSNTKAEILLFAPKTVQTLIAAAGDYYTWKLAETAYGSGTSPAAATLILTVASPWQWFCSTRTFSNCLETTLTVVALCNWPWHWSVTNDDQGHFQVDEQGLRIRDADIPSKGAVDETTRLRRTLLFAAVATILRPTNILVWLSLTCLTFLRREKLQRLVKVPFTNQSALVDAATWTFVPSKVESLIFAREVVLCGGAVLSLSAIVDRLFYKTWTFPPFNFLYFNVLQSLAIFYGNNNWHYYLSQGYPLLLITALPFTLVGMYMSCIGSKDLSKLSFTSRNILLNLTGISLFVPAILSIISHKEVRFIYPLLPGLHILAAQPLAKFFATAFQQVVPSSQRTQLVKRLLLGCLLSLNFLIALYTSTTHNSGLINVTHYLRHEFESYYLPSSTSSTLNHRPLGTQGNMTVAFLMPCHSTPWRSHLQYPPTSSAPGIDAWALTCEPPLNLNATAKVAYLDEADQFYADPSVWLKRHMSRHPPGIPDGGIGRAHEPGVFAQHRPRRMFEIESGLEEGLWRERKGRRPWPEYLVFFGQLEREMRRAGLGGFTDGNGSGGNGGGGYYKECARIWNSHFHDDWRRTGDVIVWCLYEERIDSSRRKVAEREAELAKVRLKEDAKEKLREDVKNVKKRVERVERVVEKPFWKQQPLGVVDDGNGKGVEGWWDWVLKSVGWRKREKTRDWRSWWEGGDWS